MSACYSYHDYSVTNSPHPQSHHYSSVKIHDIQLQPVCYWETVPVYGNRQIVSYPSQQTIIAGSAIGAAMGNQMVRERDRTLGTIAGAVVGGSIASSPQVRNERFLIGYDHRRVCR
jgi:outer membrane lipoprotein SlyB